MTFKQNTLNIEKKIKNIINLYNQKLFKDVIFYGNKYITDHPNVINFYNIVAVVEAELGMLDDALKKFKKIIKLNPSFYQAYNNIGNILLKKDKIDDAIASYKKVLTLNLYDLDANFNLGLSYSKKNKIDISIAYYKKVINLNAKYYKAYVNLGNELENKENYLEAIEVYQKAIPISPNIIEIYFNIGIVNKKLGLFDTALDNYDEAIALNPNYSEAIFNKSLILLAKCNYNHGWLLYEARWKTKEFPPKYLDTKEWIPNIKNKVLLWAEQGIGDEIMFASLINEFQFLCEHLCVSIDKRLINLFNRSFSKKIKFYDKQEEISNEEYDVQISMGNLCKYLRKNKISFQKGNLQYLHSDKEKNYLVSKYLNRNHKKKLCGISWYTSNTNSGKDRNIQLHELIKIIPKDKYDIVNLQYGDFKKEINKINVKDNLLIETVEEIDIYNDIDGFASLIEQCDLVISIGNSTAHLSAALGKDTRVLLPRIPSWRWHLDTNKCDWYSSVKVYRQEIDHNWNKPLNELKNNLIKI